MLVFCLLKTKREFKNLCKQEIQVIFTRMIKYEDQTKRTKSDKVFRDKAFKLQAIQKVMEIKKD